MPYERLGIARSGALLIIAAVVPVLVFAGFSAVGVYSDRQTELRNRALSEAHRLLEATDHDLATSLDQAQSLAALPALDSPADVAAFTEVARREQARHPIWLAVALFDPAGRRLVNLPNADRLGPPAEPESFREVIRTGQPVIGHVARGPNAYGVALRAPVVRDGRATGVVTIVIRPDQIARLLAQSNLPPDWIVTIVDGEGLVAARSHSASQFIGKPASDRSLRVRESTDSGIYNGKTLEGVDTLSAFWQSPSTGWSVHIGIPRQALEAPLNRSIALTAAGCALSLMLSAVFATLLVRELRLRRQESQAMEQTQRLEALGRLTGGVAHDFNNLLMIIQGNAETLQRRMTAENARRPLAAIREATDRASRLTRELLVFARGGSAERTIVDLNEAIADFLDPLREGAGQGVRVEVDLDPQAGRIEVDRVQFELALLNLTVNARDAMSGMGTVTIETRRLSPQRVTVRVTDTGPGFDPTVASRAFDPFFTTKPIGVGTGLGLTQVYGFARQAGGEARIGSAERGAAIIIELPVSTRAESSAPLSAPPLLSLEGRKILLLDDNRDVRSVSAEHLRETGAVVVEADNVTEGFAALEAGAFDLIISDIVMPGAENGLALADRVQARSPAVPVLLVSGYSEFTQEAVARGFTVLRKPFSLAELDAALAKLLAGSNSASMD